MSTSLRDSFARLLLSTAKLYTHAFPTGRGRLWLATRLSHWIKLSRSPLSRCQEIHRSTHPIRYRYSARNVVGLWLELFGAWEEPNLTSMVDFLKALPPAERTLLDIGANYGLYAITAACHVPRLTAYAFECDPDVCLYLRQNVELNREEFARQGSDVQIVNKAVSDRQGEVSFWKSADDGDGSLLSIGYEGRRGAEIRVDCVDGPWIADLLGTRMADFAKIDVQGAELAVVGSLQDLFSARRFRRLQIELSRGSEPVIERMRQQGYDLVAGDLSTLRGEPWGDFVFEPVTS